jgi:hypothetical protein
MIVQQDALKTMTKSIATDNSVAMMEDIATPIYSLTNSPAPDLGAFE